MDFKLKKIMTYNNKKEFKVLRQIPEVNHLSDTILEIMYNRGFRTVQSILDFLEKDLMSLYDTRLMKDAEKAVDILIEAIKNKLHIINYSDFDCDGACSSICCVKAIRTAGGYIDYYTNNRFEDGYGICKKGIDNILKKYPDTKIILTSDNGIVGYEGIEYAKQKGLIVIVTDHHEQGKTLPNADAIVDPKRKDDNYPFSELCGAGVIFKLMLLLYYKMGLSLKPIYDLIDVVGMATVGDIVPLLDENRILVKEGIKKIKEESNLVFKILREKTEVKQINSDGTLAFVYVPMINALGRLLGSPDLAIDMFLSDDEDFIRNTIDKIYELNEQRKVMTNEQFEISEKVIEDKGLKPVIVVYDDNFHEGIIGLIAGKLKEKYHRPTFVLTNHNVDSAKGSCRSIDNFHINDYMFKIDNLLIQHGGHAKAGGLSLYKKNLNEFEEAINKLAMDNLTEDDFKEHITVDTVINAEDVSLDLIDDLKMLEPYGEQFQAPLVGLNNFSVNKVYYMGEDKQHLKLVDKNNLSVIYWNGAHKFKTFKNLNCIKVIGTPQINVYNNQVNIQFIVKDDMIS